MSVDPRVLPEHKRKNQPPLALSYMKAERHHELRSLSVIQNRESFLLVWPAIQGASKSFAAIAGIVFAGSLTFLGLRAGGDGFNEIEYLKSSWLALAVSVAMHLFVYMAAVDGFISHGRTEMHTKKAEELLSADNEREVNRGLKEGVRAHWAQRLFFKSVSYLILTLILQALSLIAGGILMAAFVMANL